MKRLLLPTVVVLALTCCGQGTRQAQSTSAATPSAGGQASEAPARDKASRLLQASYEKNGQSLPTRSWFGGNEPRQRSELLPDIPAVYRGSPFAEDYREDRGHTWAWEDLRGSRRVSAKTPGSCISCKTPDVAKAFAEQGWAYASRPLSGYTAEDHPSVSCASCHDPATNSLRVVQPGFVEAAGRIGIDLAKASRAQMRNFVCAQCHAEYYFEPGTSRVILPWDSGLTPPEIYDYYAQKPGGFEADYANPSSGARLLKAQHPDYEAYSGGVHASAGVSCATCHMPRVTEDGVTYTSHWVTSPLERVSQACLPCHRTKTEDWITSRVRYIQESVMGLQRTAAQALVRGHAAIAAAAAARADRQLISQARESLRRAQWYWDFAASENSTGFHDPVMSQNILAQSISLAAEALQAAWRAAGRPVGVSP